MKHEIVCVKSTQTAIPEIQKPEKTLYYLIIGEGENKVELNVGQKTYEKVQKLNKK